MTEAEVRETGQAAQISTMAMEDVSRARVSLADARTMARVRSQVAL
jgi:hypothetical protein